MTWFEDWVDLEEIDHEDVKMRLFSHSLAGDIKKWFRGLVANSIANLEAFGQAFLDRWEEKRDPSISLA